MLDAKALEVDAAPRETYWPLDPDVDLAASDVAEWFRTGDGLVVQSKGRPSVIRWRPLTLPEQGLVASAMRSAATSDGYAMSILCVSHGLISIDGIQLETEAVPTGRRLRPQSVAKFEQLAGEIEGLGYVSPIVWLGGLVATASFRRGG